MHGHHVCISDLENVVTKIPETGVGVSGGAKPAQALAGDQREGYAAS